MEAWNKKMLNDCNPDAGWTLRGYVWCQNEQWSYPEIMGTLTTTITLSLVLLVRVRNYLAAAAEH